MTARPVLPSLEELRSRYAGIFDDRSPVAMSRDFTSLRRRVLALRRAHVPDVENPYVALLLELGAGQTRDPLVPTVRELRLRFRVLYAKEAPTAARRAALSTLRSRATVLRQMGVANDVNPADAILREIGHPVFVDPYPRLTAQGLIDLPVRGPAPRQWRRIAEDFLTFTDKPIEEIKPRDPEIFLQRAGREFRDDGWDHERSRLWAFLEACERKGVLRDCRGRNPLRTKSRHLVVATYPKHIQAEHAALKALFVKEDYTWKTEEGRMYSYRRGLKWLGSRATDRKRKLTLAAATWPRGGAEQFMEFYFARSQDGDAAPETQWHPCISFLRNLWTAARHQPRLIDDRIRSLERSFRSNGRDSGPITRIRLRPADPPPGPSDEQCANCEASFERDLARLQAPGADPEELDLVAGDRLATHMMRRVAMRRGSIAACRWDQLFVDEIDGSLYFRTVVKPSRRRKRNLTHEQVKNRRGYGRWYQDAELLPEMQAKAALTGQDLLKWLETRDRRYLNWVKVTSPDPFGETAIGTEVSPVWTAPGLGFLTAQMFGNRMKAVAVHRLGLSEGACHIWRRRAVADTEPIASRAPLALERLFQMTGGTRRRYLITTEQSVSHALPGSRTAREVLAALRSGTSGEPTSTPTVSAPRPTALPAPAPLPAPAVIAPKPKRAGSSTAARPRLRLFTLGDVIGRSA
jgi:hypothetical protein